MMSWSEHITGWKDITGKILEEVHRPYRRFFLISPFQPESQFKTIAADLRIITFFIVQFRKTISYIMPVWHAFFTLPDFHTVQGIVSSQPIGQQGTVIETILIRILLFHNIGNGIEAFRFFTHFLSLSFLTVLLFTVHTSPLPLSSFRMCFFRMDIFPHRMSGFILTH